MKNIAVKSLLQAAKYLIEQSIYSYSIQDHIKHKLIEIKNMITNIQLDLYSEIPESGPTIIDNKIPAKPVDNCDYND